MTAVALGPLWMYLLAKSALHPDGFWQNLILVGVGVYLLGFIQIILGVTLIAVLIAIWAS
jgi:hypothetical protein